MIHTAHSIKTISRALSIILGALLLSHAHAEARDQGSEITRPHQPINNQSSFFSSLPLELFEEANWQACRTECARILISHPTPELRLMHATCGLRLGLNTKPELKKLCSPPQQPKSTHPNLPQSIRGTKRNWLEPVTAMNEENDNPVHPVHPCKYPPLLPILPMAHYELGRAYWIEGNTSNAFINIKQAFLTATTVDLYQHSGCTLYILLKENPNLYPKSSGLQTILATCRKEWDLDLFKECRKPKTKKNGIATAPGRWLISFYQKQIGPAIGDRCSLHPSCSHYAMESLQKHGLIGVGAMSDRFIREPDVVKYRKNPTKINGHTKYSDPLSDHDWWMKK